VPEGYSNTKELGRLIYTEYVYPFEIAAVILLVAIVAAIALTLRHRKTSKYQTRRSRSTCKPRGSGAYRIDGIGEEAGLRMADGIEQGPGFTSILTSSLLNKGEQLVSLSHYLVLARSCSLSA
jgi:hypothetical protein